MKKHILVGLILLSLGFCAFAGDAAVFVDSGFSKDGSVYVFGQYGKTDRTYEAYAEIYTVNVEKNQFVPGEVFKTDPSAATAAKSGKEVYENLEGKSYYKIGKYGCTKVNPDNLLYYCEDENKDAKEEITFTDFSGSTVDDPVFYHIALVSTVSGSGVKASSSFYISVKKEKNDGTVLSEYKVGSPQVRRTGVTGYRISRIFTDASGKSLVFVVEKTVEDKSGTCIRYMVETVKL